MVKAQQTKVKQEVDTEGTASAGAGTEIIISTVNCDF